MSDQPTSGSAGTTDAATCYRHPQREAHIRCVRCDRRICPDCMIDASVGFQCPECVAQGNKGVRQARTVFGGRVANDAGYVSKALIGVNLVVFVLQTVSSEVTARFVLVPGFAGFFGVADGEFYRLITAAFLHGGFAHLALNMYALFILGPPLERAFGRVRFIVLYAVAALGGAAASYAFLDPQASSLGASGAIFGLMGTLLVVGRRLGTDPRAVLVLLAINIALPFLIPNIDWRAHLGGLVAGGLCALVLARSPQKRRLAAQTTGVLILLLIIAAVVVWRTAQLTA